MRPQSRARLVCLSSRLARSLYTTVPRRNTTWTRQHTPRTSPPLSKRLRAVTGRDVVSSLGKVLDRSQQESDNVVDTLKGALWSESHPARKRMKRKKNEASEEPSAKIGTEGWATENWKDDWGEDTLKPPKTSQEIDSRPVAPPHLDQGLPLAYSRRIEGLLEDVPRTVLEDLSPPTKQQPIATLKHGLERVLFNPGVHWLRDPRSRVYNYPPALGIIPKVVDFAFERLTGFIRSSHDQDLWSLAKSEKRKFAGSTSSLSGMLCQIYFLLSGNKSVDISTLSTEYRKEATNFTPGQRMPASVVFNHKDGVYLIDSDPTKQEMAEKNILTWMGTLLEKYLTLSSEEFLTYMRSQPSDPQVLEEAAREAYRYSKSNKFVMRSQLDCHDKRLPGTGVFDIKTRACVPIRMDVLNFKENSGYLIRHSHGLIESFEKEYYDLIRSAFLKYSFQVRIGNMDGVLVTYHNTARVFGFQYVSLDEMDQRLFGQGPGTGDRVFQKCVEMLELVAEEISLCFPGQSVKCTFETEDSSKETDMNVWVEPVDWPPPSSTPSSHLDSEGGNLRPIRQLIVSASSFCGNSPTRGSRCVPTMDRPWTVHWSIKRLTSSSMRDDAVRASLRAAKERQFRPFSLPSGVLAEKIQEWWEALNFGGVGKDLPLAPIDGGDVEGSEVEGVGVDMNALPERNETTEQDEDAESSASEALSSGSERRRDSFWEKYFVEPDPRIQQLRSLAQQGREDTIRMALEERGKPKIVLGVGEVEWEDEWVEAEIEAQEAAVEAARIAELERGTMEEDSDELLSAVVKPVGEVSDLSLHPSMRSYKPSLRDDLTAYAEGTRAALEKEETYTQADAAQNDSELDAATRTMAEFDETSTPFTDSESKEPLPRPSPAQDTTSTSGSNANTASADKPAMLELEGNASTSVEIEDEETAPVQQEQNSGVLVDAHASTSIEGKESVPARQEQNFGILVDTHAPMSVEIDEEESAPVRQEQNSGTFAGPHTLLMSVEIEDEESASVRQEQNSVSTQSLSFNADTIQKVSSSEDLISDKPQKSSDSSS